MFDILIDKIRRQAVRVQLSTGQTVLAAFVNPTDWGLRERSLDNLTIFLDASLPPGGFRVSS